MEGGEGKKQSNHKIKCNSEKGLQRFGGIMSEGNMFQ